LIKVALAVPDWRLLRRPKLYKGRTSADASPISERAQGAAEPVCHRQGG